MNDQLERRVLEVINERWQGNGCVLASDELYTALRAAGEVIPDGALPEVLRQLSRRGVIMATYAPVINAEAARRDGAVLIRDVSPAVLG